MQRSERVRDQSEYGTQDGKREAGRAPARWNEGAMGAREAPPDCHVLGGDPPESRTQHTTTTLDLRERGMPSKMTRLPC
jgi:hypothetical protein